jgi:hypothetical protein
MYEYICNNLLPAVDETKVKVDSFFRESFYASSITPLSRIVITRLCICMHHTCDRLSGVDTRAESLAEHAWPRSSAVCLSPSDQWCSIFTQLSPLPLYPAISQNQCHATVIMSSFRSFDCPLASQQFRTGCHTARLVPPSGQELPTRPSPTGQAQPNLINLHLTRAYTHQVDQSITQDATPLLHRSCDQPPYLFTLFLWRSSPPYRSIYPRLG